jgi:tripartite-type tricarboxylate transporter receptor subunit TctC
MRRGIGGPDHTSGELFKITTGIAMTDVPYHGLAPALSDLMGGQVQLIFSTVPAAIEYIKAGRLHTLAMTTATRSELVPDIPTLSDFLAVFEASAPAVAARGQVGTARTMRIAVPSGNPALARARAFLRRTGRASDMWDFGTSRDCH